jgi:hypothetical protein
MRDTGAQDAVYVWRFAHRRGRLSRARSGQPAARQVMNASTKSRAFERPGFVEDVDVQPAAGVRVVQLTPAGSECSIDTGTDCRPTTGWHRARSRACSWWRPASSRPPLNWPAAALRSALWKTGRRSQVHTGGRPRRQHSDAAGDGFARRRQVPSLIAISSECAESDSGRALRSSGGPDVSSRAFTRTRMPLPSRE